MDATTLARMQAAGRLAFGTAMIVSPGTVASAWIGGRAGRRDGTKVLTQALGIRDAAIAGGVLTTAGSSSVKPWLLASVASDAVDLAATLRARDSLPPAAVAGVGVIAGASVALGLYLVSG